MSGTDRCNHLLWPIKHWGTPDWKGIEEKTIWYYSWYMDCAKMAR